MHELLVRLDALDPHAGAALRVIAYFDDLHANKAGLQAIVRGAAVLAACPAALVDPVRQLRLRVDANGVAGKPSVRDRSWPWIRVGAKAEFWLERDGDPYPIDAMILERAAAAVDSVHQRSRPGPLTQNQLNAAVEVLLNPETSTEERSLTAKQLGMPVDGRFRVIAETGGHLRIGAVNEVGPDGRAGIGTTAPLDGLPASAAAARLAWQLTAAGTADDPGPRVVRADRSEGLLLLASAIGPQTPEPTDVRTLEHATREAPWLLGTLTAVADTPSLRAAATTLHMHHSTLQERLTHAEKLLGWTVTDPPGRLRLQLALAMRRVFHNRS